jgi:hypothetical protein
LGKTAKRTVTIKNTSSSKIDVTIAGEIAAAPFGVKSQCIKTLSRGKKCKVVVTFSPIDTNPQTGELIVHDGAEGAPQTVPLTGTGR